MQKLVRWCNLCLIVVSCPMLYRICPFAVVDFGVRCIGSNFALFRRLVLCITILCFGITISDNLCRGNHCNRSVMDSVSDDFAFCHRDNFQISLDICLVRWCSLICFGKCSDWPPGDALDFCITIVLELCQIFADKVIVICHKSRDLYGLCQCCQPVDCLFWHPLRGIRVGEAGHPGPSDSLHTRLCITNPTCIVNKHDYYLQLAADHQVTMFTASETAATLKSQQSFNANMRRGQFKTLWSVPMENQFHRSDGGQSLRGKASGTALLASIPCREAIDTISPQWYATGRLLHSVVSLGCLQVQVMVIYGLPSSRCNSATLNSQLVLEAVQACSYLALPFIIAGDFNVNPFALECGATLLSLGLKDLTVLSQMQLGKSMPPTCRDTTIADNALVSPELFQFISDIWVGSDQYFDAHRPVFVDFATPLNGYLDRHLKQPRSWIELDIADDLFPEAYRQATEHFGTPSTIEQWGMVVESAVDIAFRQQQGNQGVEPHSIRGLPKRFRGRCKPAVFHNAFKKSLTPPTRPGDYQPPGEIYDFATRKKVIHLRRIHSFLRRFQKNHHHLDCFIVDLLQEWDAILRCRVWGVPFHLWCIQQPELGPPAYPLLTFEYIQMVYQLVKFQTDADVYAQQSHWRMRRKLNQLWDGKHKGFSNAFAQMKQSFRPPVSELKVSISDNVHIVPGDDNLVTAFAGYPSQFCPHTLVKVDETACAIQQVDDYSLTLKPLSALDLDREEFLLQQQCVLHDPSSIFDSLSRYWKQFWHPPEDHETVPNAFLKATMEATPALHLPDIKCDDPALWSQAIHSLKASTARGVDNISAAELKQLPPLAISHLCTIMSSYTDGFPKWFAVAKTFLVPKVEGTPSASEIRPISVLPQLYRLWSKVVCGQIFKSFANQIPMQVTGMLQNRGPMDSAYDWQYWLEFNHHHDIPASGLSLDLLKCFNTIDQEGALYMLRSLGLPDAILRQWFGTIQQLSRLWILGASVSQPQDCFRGFPEGDSFSVVVMICIGHVWTSATQRISSTIKSSAYADNWGWATVQPRLHRPILELTTSFVDSLGMIVDWKKCWMWGCSKQHLTLLRNALAAFVLPNVVATVATAQDLGCNMTYHGPPKLGKLSLRIQNAHRRLEQLAKLQFDLKTNVHLVRGGIFSSIFWGVELYPFGSQHLQTLRVKTANAILGPSVSRNSAIAIAFMPGLVDPSVYLTTRAIAAARRFLLRSDEAIQSSFLNRLACHSGIFHDCRGPIGVLKYYLLKFGWEVTRTGSLLVSAFVQLDLLTTSLGTIQQWLTWTWQQDVVPRFSMRKGLSSCLPIAIPDTIAILKTFEQPQQALLLEEIAGGFQTQHQKSVWDSNSDDKCRFCPFPDSRFHRVFQCAATGHLRQPFQDVLDKYLELDSNIHELPVILQHPFEEFIRTCHYQHPEAIIDVSLQEKISRLALLAPITFYTDGSCQHPQHPTSRHAAYAIVFDASSDDNQRRDLARKFQLSGEIPHTLQVIAVVRTTGGQSIFRSELYAILKVCEWFDNTTVFCDSAAALSAVMRCQQSCSSTMLGNEVEADILRRLWRPLQSDNRRFLKIRAHTDPHQCQDMLQCYHLLGNHVADLAAVNAAKHMFPSFVAEAEEMHSHMAEQCVMLKRLYQMLLEMASCKAQLAATLTSEIQTKPVAMEPPHRNFLAEACEWKVDEPWTAPNIVVNNLHFAAWGPFLAGALLD